jgi:hypothetical protein
VKDGVYLDLRYDLIAILERGDWYVSEHYCASIEELDINFIKNNYLYLGEL